MEKYTNTTKETCIKLLILRNIPETTEDMIVYQSVKTGEIWVRPKNMWNEIIDDNGTLRFTLVANTNGE